MTAPLAIDLTGPRVTAADVQCWRSWAKSDIDRATCDILERNLDAIDGAVEWPCSETGTIDVYLRSGDLVTIEIEVSK